MRRLLRTTLVAVIVAVIPVLFLTACSLPFGNDEPDDDQTAAADGESQVSGVKIEEPEQAPDFTLINHEAEPMSLSDLEGQIVAIFFGYTGCPDICPMTLGHMAQATEALGDDADKVDYLFISVDPERDDADRLAKHVSRIDAPITALTGERAELEQVWDDYDITVERRDRDNGGYLIDHSAMIWIVDQHGDLVMFMPMGADGEDLAAALQRLISQEG